MAVLIFFTLIGVVAWYFLRNIKEDKVQLEDLAAGDGKNTPPRGKLLDKYRTIEYARYYNAPRIHRETFFKTKEIIVVFLITIIMASIVAQSVLATTLVIVACFVMYAPLFWHANMEVRKKYNEDRNRETIIEKELAGSNDFTIPQDWTKKYL